jgi:hypothetical protein
VALAGGTPPYLYSLSSGPFQTSGTFSNLSSGDYSVTAKDQNGCSLQNNYSILSLYPPITIAQNTQNVSCYGGSNGTITLSVSGGDAPYAFTWTQPLTGATNTQTTLQPGTYVAQITDVNGCTAADTATISQPAPLTTTITSSPVCSNTSGGTITINASGGMPPYTYNSQPDSVLTNLSAGAYTITISDNNGCVTTQQASVSTDTLVPSVEFLVSTQQDALDTLEVEDISVPKPDSIQWAFAPATNIIAPGLIQYSQPGTYPATMTAFYGGCNFSVTENITIQPFDTNTYNPYVLQGQSFDSVLVAPNPNNGVFNLYVKLYKAQTLAMNVFNVSGVVVYQKQWTNQVLITEQETLPNAVPAGVYIVELITDSDVRDYNIIVVR